MVIFILMVIWGKVLSFNLSYPVKPFYGTILALDSVGMGIA